MSGIAGWIDCQHDLSQQGPLISKMVGQLSHRGPGAQSQWLSLHAALAHCCSNAIGLRADEQPMVHRDEERTYVITCDGVIYNARELRCELERSGHTFRTPSDTEVLLHAYVEWGTECVRHLHGIFAFGLWDGQKQTLLLARDRLGVKPLFYARRGSALLFGSELKALLVHPLVKTEVDAAGLAEILSFVRIPGSGIYRDVHELRPGHLLVCDEKGVHTSGYWSLRSAPHPDDLQTTADSIRALLEDAVKRQLSADVPVAALLSGGLDSSLITALAAREFKAAGKALHTYSLDFVNSAQNFQSDPLHLELDEPWAREVSRYIGTRHHTVTVDSTSLLENLLVQLHAHDTPMVGQMNTSLYLLFKAMKQEAGVVLSGESADEIFGGYPWFHHEAALNVPTFPWLPAFYGDIALSWLSSDILRTVRPFEHIEKQYYQTIANVPGLEGEDRLAARRREMFYLNLTHWLPFLLERKDRMGMAAGLQVRVPFGDDRLVEYAWNIPWEMKTVDAVEKGILRRAFARVLPEDVLYRKKSAYPNVPDPAYEEATRAWTRRILDDASAPIQPLLDSQVVRALVERARSGRSGMAQVSLFERIILINEWLRTYHVTLSL